MGHYSAIEYNIELNLEVPQRIMDAIYDKENVDGVDIERLFGSYQDRLDGVTPESNIVRTDTILIRSKAISKATYDDVTQLLELLKPYIVNKSDCLVVLRDEECTNIPIPCTFTPRCKGRILYSSWTIKGSQVVRKFQQGDPEDFYSWVS